MADLTNFSFEFFYEIFTEDASLFLLYHGAKKSKMTKNSNQGGSCLNCSAGKPRVAKKKKCKIGEHGYADSGLSWQFNTIRNDLSG